MIEVIALITLVAQVVCLINAFKKDDSSLYMLSFILGNVYFMAVTPVGWLFACYATAFVFSSFGVLLIRQNEQNEEEARSKNEDHELPDEFFKNKWNLAIMLTGQFLCVIAFVFFIVASVIKISEYRNDKYDEVQAVEVEGVENESVH